MPSSGPVTDEAPDPERRAVVRLARVVTGPLGSWAGVVFWVAVAAAAFPFANKLGSVESSRFVEFLPRNAPSTTALALDRRFPSGRTLEAVVVAYRPSGLRQGDLSLLQADRNRLQGHLGRAIGAPSPVVTSPRRDAAVVAVPIRGDVTAVSRTVTAMRALLGDGSDGLELRVTGTAAIQTDLLGAFSGVDSVLLVATAVLVAVLLAATYRSPILWLVPLVCVGIAEAVAEALMYLLARTGLTVTGQSAALVTVIVFGAGTDYALLLTARYREELRRTATHRLAMMIAWRRAAPPIAWSALTVAATLACLLLATSNITSSFGVVGIVGVASAAVVVLGAYPALLLVTGRGVFWPAVPRHAPQLPAGGPWARVAGLVTRGRRPVWLTGLVLLGGAGVGLLSVNTNVASLSELPSSAASVQGYRLLASSFPAGEVSPVDVVVTDARLVPAVRRALGRQPVTARMGPVERAGAMARFDLVLDVAPTGERAFDAIRRLRAAATTVAGDHVVIGGQTAQDLDTATTNHTDTFVVVPSVLAVVLLVLALVLRALVGPLILVATVVVSFGAALGITSAVLVPLLGLPGTDPSVPLLTFVFLVALGIDYNIFLLTRVREEVLRSDATAGVRTGVTTTGGVLTSAGVILAGTFSVLAILPIVASREIGLVVAIGILADTFLVRTVLVPALAVDLGPRFWWPTRVRRGA